MIGERVPHAMLLEILIDKAYRTMIRSHGIWRAGGLLLASLVIFNKTSR